MLCPTCQVRLIRVKTAHGMLYQCPKCGGRAAGMSLLRRVGSKKSIRLLWLHARQGERAAGAACPVCRRAMVEVPMPPVGSAGPLRLDVCPGCQFIWFDPHEFKQFPPPEPKDKRPLPDKGREALAMHRLQHVAEEAEKAEHAEHYPDRPWQWIPAALLLPYEQQLLPMARRPWLTYILAAALTAVYAATFWNLPAAVERFGLIPVEAWRLGGATFLAGCFLHGGVIHLLVNLYFLIVFGDNVEDDLGRWRFIALLAAAAVVGGAMHVLVNPQSEIPCVGAGGGISGLIVYYVLRYPRARVGFALLIPHYFRWMSLPTAAALVIWAAFQVGFYYYYRPEVSVSILADLGGAAVGLAAWGFWHLGGAKT